MAVVSANPRPHSSIVPTTALRRHSWTPLAHHSSAPLVHMTQRPRSELGQRPRSERAQRPPLTYIKAGSLSFANPWRDVGQRPQSEVRDLDAPCSRPTLRAGSSRLRRLGKTIPRLHVTIQPHSVVLILHSVLPAEPFKSGTKRSRPSFRQSMRSRHDAR